MTRLGVIETSSSSWASPIVLVKKKNGSTRFYRERARHGHSYLGVQHTPVGVHSIRRKERAILPDGTIYECQSTWIEDPRRSFLQEPRRGEATLIMISLVHLRTV